MTPKYLLIEGINSFTDKQEIDFVTLARDNIFSICGPTGSGKTTVLDSIVIALFAPRSHNRGTMQEYVNKRLDTARIVFRFEFERVDYEVERVIKKGKGITKARLTNLTLDKVLADKTEDATREITKILRIDYESFSSAVILEQGKFGKFLKSDKSTRENIVMRLFGLEKIKKLKEINLERAKNVKAQISAKNEKLSAYEDITDEIIKQKKNDKQLADKSLKDVKQTVKELGEKYERMLTAQNTALKRNKAQADLLNAEGVLAELSLRDSYVAKDKNELTQLEKSFDVLQEEYVDAVAHATLIEKYDDMCLALSEKENKLKELSRAHYKLKDELDKKQKEKDETVAMLNQKSKLAIKSANELRDSVTFDVDKKPATEVLSTAIAVANEKKQAYENYVLESETAKKEYEQAGKLWDEIQKGKAETERTLDDVLNKLKKTTDDYDKAVKANSVAVLCEGLSEGDACPICGGKLKTVPRSTETEQLFLEIENLKQTEESLMQNLNDCKAVESAQNEKLSLLIKRSKQADEKASESKKQYDDAIAVVVKGRDINEVVSLSKSVDTLNREVELYKIEVERKKAEAETVTATFNANLDEGKRLKEETLRDKKAIDDMLKGKSAKEIKDNLQNVKRQKAELELKIANLRESINDQIKDIATKKATAEQTKLLAEQIINETRDDTIFDEQKFNELIAEKNSAEQNYNDLYSKIAVLESEIISSEKLLKDKKQVVGELAELKKIEKRHAVLTELFGGRRPFLQYVLEEYVLSISAQASEILNELSGGKFTLHYDYESGDFYVADFFCNGEKRNVRTLSGGETFLACVSVAIATSREIAKGRSYNFFFLDEGFGTLHASALDTVVGALDKLSKETMVGLVSHRSELNERIASKIIVTPADELNGSKLEYSGF